MFSVVANGAHASFDIKSSSEKPLELDSFFWPVSHSERFGFMKAYPAFLRDFLANEQHPDRYLIRILHGYFGVQVATAFQAQLLKDRSAGRTVALPDHARFWKIAFSQHGSADEQLSLDPRQVEYLSRGLSAPTIRRWLRVLKPAFLSNGLKTRPLELVPLQTAIVATGGGSLVFEHARRVPESVYLSPLYEWFSNPRAEELRRWQPRPLDQELSARFLLAVSHWLQKHECRLEQPLNSFLAAWLRDMSMWIRFYYQRLVSRPERLPIRLWTGSCGIIWNRLLGYAVHERGGEVTVHDHALGAHASQNSATCYVEGQDCKNLVLYTSAIASMAKHASSWQLLSPPGPNIVGIDTIGIPAGRKVKLIKTSTRRPQVPPRRILFVQPRFMTDIGEFNPLMPDVVAADWQLRLLPWLVGKGYEVLVKPHPGSPTNLPSDVFGHLGVKVLRGRFEDVYDAGDLLLYDYPLTTTFGGGLSSGLPIVLIDFGYLELPALERQQLVRRVAVVSGSYDAENRAQVDWSRLAQAIHKAPSLKDTAYETSVLGGLFD
jgi:hypothetical protein